MAMTVDQFMAAISGQESGGSYDATNTDAGVHYGKYQIDPSNWPSWSAQAGLPPGSPMSPQNQEAVARDQMQRAYNRYGNWEDVAAMWYSGSARDPKTIDNPQGGGKYPTIRQYVDNVMQRGGAETGPGGSQMAAPTTQNGPSISDFIAGNPMPTPQPGEDPLEFQARMQAWSAAYSDFTLGNSRANPSQSGTKQTDPLTDPNSIATQQFQNKVQQFTSGLAWDNVNQSKAATDIDRFLKGQQNSQARAQTNLEGQKMLQQYGTSNGKTSFSASDLGAGLVSMAKGLGIDPNSSLVNYSGVTRIDPAADMQRYDQSQGVTGTIPLTPALNTQYGNVPVAPGMNPYGGGGSTAGHDLPAPAGALPGNIPIASGSGLPNVPGAVPQPGRPNFPGGSPPPPQRMHVDPTTGAVTFS